MVLVEAKVGSMKAASQASSFVQSNLRIVMNPGMTGNGTQVLLNRMARRRCARSKAMFPSFSEGSSSGSVCRNQRIAV
jgi:hypothetical protein